MTDTILVVEDDPSILKGLDLNLRLEGYRVLTARDGEEGLALFRQNRPDLVLLDVMLPRLDGIEVVRMLRAEGADTPILILSAKGHEADKVMGLSIGADDYLTKPFGLPELLARIRAALRRSRRHAAREQEIGFGDVRIDLEARRVVRAGVEIEMTAREFDLLRHFVTHADVAFSREQLMRAVWGVDHYGTVRTVDNFVGRLRQKLEENPDDPRWIETVRGVGYRFRGPGS